MDTIFEQFDAKLIDKVLTSPTAPKIRMITGNRSVEFITAIKKCEGGKKPMIFTSKQVIPQIKIHGKTFYNLGLDIYCPVDKPATFESKYSLEVWQVD